MAAAVAGSSSGRHFAVACGVGGDSACSTPFVSAPSRSARDLSFHAAAGFCFSAPASPARRADDCDYEFDFDFDFSSQFPSPAAATAAMSSADELFHNGQIRPMRLSSFLLRPQAPPPLADRPAGDRLPPMEAPAPLDERGRFRSRSVHRRSRSLSPFRAHWMSPSSSPAPAKGSAQTPTSSASRSSSSSSTASSDSSSTSRNYRRWRFLKKLTHQNKSEDSKRRPAASLPPAPTPTPACAKKNALLTSPKTNPTPAVGRRSAHERLYEARRAEAEDLRRRTYLPYRQGLLLGCLGFGSRGYGAMHGFAAKSRC